jgi:uncharacterized protein YdcH (DUF465 family)
MGASDTDRKAILEQDEDFRRLAEKHRRCEARLQELQTRHYPSPEEQMEEIQLKKEKLALKDRMRIIERRRLEHNGQVATG